MPNKFYAYVLPDKNESGITKNWKDCEEKVSGKNARYKSFNSENEATQWLKDGANYEIKPKQYKKLESGIYFDSGTGRNGKVEVSVTDENGNNLLEKITPKLKLNKFGKLPVPKATNNYGELLGCKYALKLATKNNVKKIFGDSKLVLNYWSKGFIKKELPNKTQKLSKEVSKLRNIFEEAGGKIEFIEGDFNPADLGFHR
jgi:ribonuclease HI